MCRKALLILFLSTAVLPFSATKTEGIPFSIDGFMSYLINRRPPSPPKFVFSTGVISVPVEAAVGHVIGQVQAETGEGRGVKPSIIYYIEDPSKLFDVHSTSGVLTVANRIKGGKNGLHKKDGFDYKIIIIARQPYDEGQFPGLTPEKTETRKEIEIVIRK